MQNAQSIIKNNDQDKKLWEDGYAVIPFLNEEEVKTLVDFFYEHHQGIEHAMYATAHVKDIVFRQKMNEKIREVFQRAISENLTHVNPLGGSFIVKGKGEQGILQPHMDWNIVNEEEQRSFNIWVPLVDVNENNGALKVLPGSHSKVKVIRGSNIDNPFYEVYPLIWKNSITIEMKAGEAFLYDHRLLHASSDNKTDELRIAIAYGVIPENAQMYYYYKNGESVEEYICPPSFYMTENPNDGPIGLQLNRSFNYSFPIYNEKEFSKFFGIQNKKPTFFEKLKEIFN